MDARVHSRGVMLRLAPLIAMLLGRPHPMRENDRTPEEGGRP